MTSPVIAVVIVAAVDVAADRHVPAGLSDPERSTVGGLSPSIREVIKSRGPAEAFLKLSLIDLRAAPSPDRPARSVPAFVVIVVAAVAIFAAAAARSRGETRGFPSPDLTRPVAA